MFVKGCKFSIVRLFWRRKKGSTSEPTENLERKLSSYTENVREFLKDCDRVPRRMGNAGSARTSKARKEGKRGRDSVDDHSGNNKKTVKNSDLRANGKEIIKYRSTNPFIIFFLRLRGKKPTEHVTVIARVAGKLWTQMTPEQRKKYVDLATIEKKRREEQRKKRKTRRR